MFNDFKWCPNYFRFRRLWKSWCSFHSPDFWCFSLSSSSFTYRKLKESHLRKLQWCLPNVGVWSTQANPQWRCTERDWAVTHPLVKDTTYIKTTQELVTPAITVLAPLTSSWRPLTYNIFIHGWLGITAGAFVNSFQGYREICIFVN